MAMSSVIGRVPHTVVPFTLPAIASPRIAVSSLITAAAHGSGDVRNQSFVSSHHCHFSPVTADALKQVDQKLSKALKSQFKSTNLPDPSLIPMPEAPPGFPFEIEDNLNDLEITLKREFGGEKIEVTVYEPIYPENWSEKDGGDDSSTESSDGEEHGKRCFTFDKPRIQLTMNITKESGPTMSIYLWANVGYVGHPEIFIKPGSRVSNEMSFDKEEYWREFIRVRGIDDSIGKFMMDYMERRAARKYFIFWKKVSNFVEG